MLLYLELASLGVV